MATQNEIKTIKELLNIGVDNEKIDYHIPSYQRGYKWKKKQVEDLLNDLKEFSEFSKDEAKFYCLQPIMVKKDGNKYNVIDGQQRLTTLYLTCKVLDLKVNCVIEYGTRRESTEFLKSLKCKKVNPSDNDKFSMDYYFMKSACKTIKAWFGNDNNKKEAIESLLQADKTSEKYVGVIWYESDESKNENETDLFANVNSGKIPLNDAELIKAQLLLKDEANEIQDLRQIEKAKEWDDMEYALQDDEFFSFLVNDKKSYDTRILLLFEIYYNIYCENNSDKDKSHTNQYHAVFEAIQTKLTSKDSKECFWQEIKKIFLTLTSWYKNSQYYHLIGFLLEQDESLAELYKEAQKQTKTAFLDTTIKEKIKAKIGININNKRDLKQIKSLVYGDNSKELKSILLLFNMLSYIDSQHRFSFDIYKDKEWELEHIHAQQDKTKQMPLKEKLNWLRDSKEILKNAEQSTKEQSIEKIRDAIKKVETLQTKLNARKNNIDDYAEEFEKCVKDIFDIFKGDELHTIGNLTLLAKSENSSLNNAVFAMKQQRIKEKEQQGKFIPLCTRNVFFKYYTKEQNISQALFWSKKDSEYYQEAIINKIQKSIL